MVVHGNDLWTSRNASPMGRVALLGNQKRDSFAAEDADLCRDRLAAGGYRAVRAWPGWKGHSSKWRHRPSLDSVMIHRSR